MTRALLFLIFLLAFALRVVRLDWQSLWADEGASAVMAARSLPQILEAAAGDIHPPLYYILLHWWSLLAGISEFSLRFLSVTFGLVLVALLFTLGRRLLSEGVGLLGAFVTTLSPFQVYYAQEARMYMPVAALGVLSIYLFWRRMQATRGGWLWLAYLAATLAALYTQYFALSLLLLENLLYAFLFLLSGVHRRLWRGWLLVQGAMLLLYLPWLARAWPQLSSWPAVSQPLALGELVWRSFLVFSFGLTWDVTATQKTEAFFLVLLGASLLWPLLRVQPRREAWGGLGLLLAYLTVPLLFLYVLSLRRPMFNPKFLLLATPPFYLLLAAGVATLSQVTKSFLTATWTRSPRLLAPWLQWMMGSLLLLAMAYVLSRSLLAYYLDPKYARDDYRGLARHIELSAMPEDAILLDAPGQVEIFNYYYRGALPRYLLPQERPPRREETVKALDGMAEKHTRFWGVFWAEQEADPEGIIDAWLGDRTYPASNHWFGSVRLTLYIRDPISGALMERPVMVSMGDGVRLLGYSLQGTNVRLPVSAKPGESLGLKLIWEATHKLEQRYSVFVHLMDEEENLWGQHDSEPKGGRLPTTAWKPGEAIRDPHGITILEGTPPGDYWIEVGLYEASSGRRLPLLDEGGKRAGDRVLLGPVRVEKASKPPSLESLLLQRRLQVNLGPLQLLGYSLTALGFSQPQREFQRGGVVHLTLLWQTKATMEADYQLSLVLLDATGAIVLKRDGPLGGLYPSSRWEAGEVVREQHRIPLDLPAGEYRWVLEVDGLGGLDLGSIRIR